ncbi:MAG: PhzF family phenazine biosynthesis protein [Methylococcaceae bacterium]
MNYKYYIADVFTNQAFNGAQVAVFPSADGLSDQQMAQVARELNLSETVFLFKKDQLQNSRRMRTFSPYGEIGFTGHPVVAAAFVSASCGEFELTEQYTSLVFEQNAGPVNVNVTNTDGKPSFVQFTRQVAPIVDYYTPTENELAGFLGIDDGYIDTKKYSTRLVSCGFPYLIVPVFYYETVRKAKYNLSAWSQSIAPQTAAQEILLFSPKTPHQDSDFAVRLMGPNIGIHDDPPVGTALAAFASYLCSFDHMQKGTYTFAVDRGDINVRRSVLNLEMDHKGEDTLTLRVGGEAVVVADGTMYIPE